MRVCQLRQDSDRARQLLNLAALEPSHESKGMCLDVYASLSSRSSAGMLQGQILSILHDKLWRMKAEDKMRKIIAACHGF